MTLLGSMIALDQSKRQGSPRLFDRRRHFTPSIAKNGIGFVQNANGTIRIVILMLARFQDLNLNYICFDCVGVF